MFPPVIGLRVRANATTSSGLLECYRADPAGGHANPDVGSTSFGCCKKCAACGVGHDLWWQARRLTPGPCSVDPLPTPCMLDSVLSPFA